MNSILSVVSRKNVFDRSPIAWRRLLLLVPTVALAVAGNAQAANTAASVNSGANVDLSNAASYSTATLPTATTDVNFLGTNTYTGTATVNGANLIYGTLNDNITTGTITISNTNATAGSITLSTAADTVGGAATDLLYVKSGGTLALQNGTGTLTLILNATGNIDTVGTLNASGPISINAGTTTFSGSGTSNISGAVAFNTGTAASFTGSGHSNLSGAISGSGTVTVSNGTVTLSGTNSYTGLTTISGGTLILSGNDTSATGGLTQTSGTLYLNSATALGTGAFTISGGTIQNSSGAAVTETNTASSILLNNNFTLGVAANTGGNGNINFGAAPVTLNASRSITLAGTGATFTFGGQETTTATGNVTTTVNGVGNTLVYAGGYTLGGNNNNSTTIFNGTSNVTLLGTVSSFAGDNQALTYSGTGTLTLGGNDTSTGLTTVSQGTLLLDFSQEAAPATATNILNAASSLALNNTLVVKGASGATNSQQFANVTLVGANNESISLNQNGATSLSLALGSLHRSLSSTADFTLPTTGSITVSSPGLTNGAGGNPNVISYAVANGGATWATFNSSTGAIGALSSYVTGAGNYTAGNNVDVTDGDTVSNVTVNTLRFNSPTETLNLGGTDTITDGVLVTPTSTSATINGGTIETNTPANEIVFQNYGGTLNIGSTIADNASGPTAVTIGGTGTTILSGANTYTGVTTVAGGTLSLNGSDLSIAALSGGIDSIVALGSNTLYIDNGANNAIFQGTFTGTTFGAVVKNGSGAEYFSNPLAVTQTFTGGITVADGWLETQNTIGANANVITLGGGSNGDSSFSNSPTTLYLNGGNSNAIDVEGGGTGALTLIGNSFIESGSGTFLTLTNDPTLTVSSFGYDFLGRSVVNGQFSLKGGVSGQGNVLINSGTGSALQFYATAINNTGIVNVMSLGTSGTNIGNAGANAGLGANVTALVVASDGGGTVDYMPQNDTGFKGPIFINAGTLSDDTSQNNAGTSNVTSNAGLFNSAVSLTMGGGAFQVKGTGTGSFKAQDQVISGLTLNAGSSTVDVLNPSGATSTTLDLSGPAGTSTITRNVGGTVNFIASTGTFGTTSVVKVGSSTVNDAGGILGGYATVSGTSWATVSSGAIAALGTYGTLASSTATTNVDVAAGAQTANNLAANTLRFNSGSSTLTLSGTNVLTDGGILDTTAGGTSSITGGTLEGSAGSDLVVIQDNTSAGLTIASTIADNTSATALTKSGTGTLYLTNTANTYTGATYINAGILNVATLAASGTASSIGTGAGGLVLNGGTLQYTGTAAANLSRNFTLTTAGGSFDASGTGSGVLTISGAMTVTGTSQTVGGVATDVGGAQNLNLTGTGTGVYSGVITNGSVADDYTAVNKTGTGTWTLSNANTYTGYTTISAGTLVANNVSALGNLNGINVVNPAFLVLSGGTLDIATDTSINAYNTEVTTSSTIVVDRATSGAAVTQNLGSLSMTGGTLTANAGVNVSGTALPLLTFNSLVLNNSGNGGYTLYANTADISILGNVTSTANIGGTQTLTLESSNTGTSTITGSLSDGINGGVLALTRNIGSGTWVLTGANTYTGATNVTLGVLNIQNNSALGTTVGNSSSSVTVGSGGVLQLQGGITTTTAIVLNLNGTGVGSTGTGALENVSGDNVYTGLADITGSNVTIGSDSDTLTLSNTGTIVTTAASGADTLNFVGAGNTTLDGGLGNGTGTSTATLAITKSGSGTLTLYGASTYTGTTAVSAGTLLVDNTTGSGTGTGTVTVSGTSTVHGTLGGGSTAENGGTLYTPDTDGAALQVFRPNVTGIIAGQVNINSNGILAPGNSVGTLTVAKLTLAIGSIADYEFNSTSNDYTVVTTSGGLSIQGGGFNLYQEGTTNAFDTVGVYDLIGYTGALTGAASNLTVLNQQAGFNYVITNDSTDSIIQLDITASTAPEPGTWAMLAGGLCLLVLVIRRRANLS